MPLNVYRAMTQDGYIVKNRVEEVNRHILVKKLKGNKLIPISVTPIKVRRNNISKKKKNVKELDTMRKNLNSGDLLAKRRNKKKNVIQRLNEVLARTEKITERDIVVFTQNFYLLKKANFNNIHALNTIIEGTENVQFREVLEDILAGVEARRKYVFNNGILSICFPIHIR